MYYFHTKIKNLKNPEKNIFSGFFGVFFLGFLGGYFWVGFFGWVFYCQPCDKRIRMRIHTDPTDHDADPDPNTAYFIELSG